MSAKAGSANLITGTRILCSIALPLTLPTVELKHSVPFVCTVATIAAIQEGDYIRTGRDSL